LVRWRRCSDALPLAPVVVASTVLFVGLMAFIVVLQRPPG
jgi:hypothetical protein